jgi:pimeloyl-ACP methyl ester carboxylesterase
MLVPIPSGGSEQRLPVDEQAVAASPDLQSVMGRNIRQGYRQGWYGPVQDDFLVHGPWGFALQDVDTPFDLWQGARDTNVPRCQGEYQHKCLPHSRLHILENTAHLFPLVRWEEILRDLIREEDEDDDTGPGET